MTHSTAWRRGGMAKILIVDDDEMERLLLQACLEGEHDLVFAANGRIAERLVKDEPIDLIITDLAMPEINGLRLIKDLREEGETMPIIAISGAAPEQLDLAQDYGAQVVLYKPIERDRLSAAVSECLGETQTDQWR